MLLYMLKINNFKLWEILKDIKCEIDWMMNKRNMDEAKSICRRKGPYILLI